jgi:hypothetical protein
MLNELNDIDQADGLTQVRPMDPFLRKPRSVDQLIVDTAFVSGSWSFGRKMAKQLLEILRESAATEKTIFQSGSLYAHTLCTRGEEAFSRRVKSTKFEVSHWRNPIGLLEGDLQRSSTNAKLLAQLEEANRLSSRLFENVPHPGK